MANLDVRELLAQVKAPTLVMHVRDDATMQPCENPTEFLREGLGIKNGSL